MSCKTAPAEEDVKMSVNTERSDKCLDHYFCVMTGHIKEKLGCSDLARKHCIT